MLPSTQGCRQQRTTGEAGRLAHLPTATAQLGCAGCRLDAWRTYISVQVYARTVLAAVQPVLYCSMLSLLYFAPEFAKLRGITRNTEAHWHSHQPQYTMTPEAAAILPSWIPARQAKVIGGAMLLLVSS